MAGQSGVAGSWSYQFSSPTGITFDQYHSGNCYLGSVVEYCVKQVKYLMKGNLQENFICWL